MSDFTYQLPFPEEKLKTAVLDALRKNYFEWASLLERSRMSIEEHGTSYYFDNAKSSRWNAQAVVIKFFVAPQHVEKLASFPKATIRQAFSDLIPAEVGYDIKMIKYIPDLSGQNSGEVLETIDTTLQAIKSTSFSQAVEHYQQAKRQFDDASDERRRKDSVRDCASAMESIIKILGNDNDIKNASKSLRASGVWGIDEIVKDGDAIFNKLHHLYPDLRHGALQTSQMSLNEAKYWIDRISTFISYMMREYENVSWLP